MSVLDQIRQSLRETHHAEENAVLARLMQTAAMTPDLRNRAFERAVALVNDIRSDDNPGLMEVFLAEYGLSTKEGIALMCLAEALLRVPDPETMDALIEDKIAPSAWGAHLGHSSSSLVNASTWALMLTGKVLQDGEGMGSVLKKAIKRVGEPVIRSAVQRAMKELGQQFVLGQTIEEAIKRGQKKVSEGFTYSYDMLGEAALTEKDAQAFHRAYADAIAKLAGQCTSEDIRKNPGISIKLSALHPRYEVGQKERVMAELTARTLELAKQARDAGMGLNIDAEEADRLDLSLDVIEAVMSDPDLAGWDGFGIVVQAYGKRAPETLDWLYALAEKLDRRIMVRLVKGAYWDTEIKRAQVEGLETFPVFTRKCATDVAYVCCAKKLLAMTDRIYPQFATHNAHTVAAILELAGDKSLFEFQRLHGMGEALHNKVLTKEGTGCRIYAPVGAHSDLLAYLVRRLLENGANSSFVNQIVDEEVPAEVVAADPFAQLEEAGDNRAVVHPSRLFGAERPNSKGFDLHDHFDLIRFDEAREPFKTKQWNDGGPIMALPSTGTHVLDVINPADPKDLVGKVLQASAEDADAAVAAATTWNVSADERAVVLNKAADLYEENFGEFFAVLTREAGKSPMDAIAELREAVDFLRFYAAQGKPLTLPARGIIACVSPWNFPLAIFTGQIAAALAAGNGVLAKPAEPTCLTACIAVKLMQQAGVPASVLQLLPGRGSVVGARMVAAPSIDGVCFTGSTATAQRINLDMAQKAAPTAPLVAETGGLNAMIVDSTALPEQAVKDIVASAFQSAGQRCSALRMLYLQEDIAGPFLEMLYGAMDELVVGNPWDHKTDVGPVINEGARGGIVDHIDAARAEGRLLKQLDAPSEGTFVGPAVIKVGGIEDLAEEIFGPVMHVATFKADQVDDVVDAINGSGYGLTFGLHTRIDDRVQHLTERLNVGNMYINRNQIGAIVGSQPFGGEGLSGTGPKAGGPNYVPRFANPGRVSFDLPDAVEVKAEAVQALLDQLDKVRTPCLETRTLPGPTGESNRLYQYGRGVILCLGPTKEAAERQAEIARTQGCRAVVVAPGMFGGSALDGMLDRSALATLKGFDAVALWSPEEDLRAARTALAERTGRLIPLLAEEDLPQRCRLERHICIDTTAAGGNASLLAGAA